jgi:hypothetical protein
MYLGDNSLRLLAGGAQDLVRLGRGRSGQLRLEVSCLVTLHSKCAHHGCGVL